MSSTKLASIFLGAAMAMLDGACYFSGSGEGYAGTQPRPTVTPAEITPAATVAPGVTPTLLPATNAAIRVQFDRGTWGDVITGTVSSKYLLWAAQGQVFTTTLTSKQSALASLYAPDGKPLYEQMAAGNTAAAKLPASGDYTLEIRSNKAFTVEVTIR